MWEQNWVWSYFVVGTCRADLFQKRHLQGNLNFLNFEVQKQRSQMKTLVVNFGIIVTLGFFRTKMCYFYFVLD